MIASSSQQSEFDSLDWRVLIKEEEDQLSPKPMTAPALRSSNNAIQEMATELIESKRVQRSMQMEMDQLRL